MTSDFETEMERRLSEAKAAENRAKAEKKAVDEELRWVRKNRVQISSDAFDLLRGQGDESLVGQMDRAWSEAMRSLREKQRRQTEAARSAVADGVDAGQGPTANGDSGSVPGDNRPGQGRAEGGGPLADD